MALLAILWLLVILCERKGMNPARTKAIERVTGVKKQRMKQVWLHPETFEPVGKEHVIGALPSQETNREQEKVS